MIQISICLSLFVEEAQKHHLSITYSGQDSETTTILNIALNTKKNYNKNNASDQMESRQLRYEMKIDSNLSMNNSNK